MGCKLFELCLDKSNEENDDEILNKEKNFSNICMSISEENVEPKVEIELKKDIQQNEKIEHKDQIPIIERNNKIKQEENIELIGLIKKCENIETRYSEGIKEIENLIEVKKDKFYYINELYGFINNGNNCYLNSSLQLLTRIKELRINILNFRHENIYIDTITKGNLCVEFQNIIQDIINERKNIDPRKLKKVMAEIDERYKDNNQEDANEFISNFLDGLLNEIGDKNNLPKPLDIKNELDRVAYDKFYKRFYKTKGNSFLLDLFYSIFKTQKVCKSCSRINSIKFNSYNIIELPIYDLAERGNDINLVEILDNYIKKNENIEGECKFCGENTIYEKINMYSLSKYLILYFGRTIDNNYIDNQIIYPDKYTFESFINNDIEYNLECVIEHSGGAHYGHYTSLCPINKENNWYKFSDTSFYKNNTSYHGKNAIILLYKKRE